jgi:hypothetical protein
MGRRSLALLFIGVSSCYSQQPIDSLRRFTALSIEEWRLVQDGQVLAKILEPNHERELAVAGVARVRVSRECFLERFRDIESFKKAPAVKQIGKFSTPIDPRDLAALALDSQDADALRHCEIGNCSVKAPLRVIQRLAREQDSPGQDYSAASNSVFREELLAYVQEYISKGDRALIRYRDKDTPVSLSQQFVSLLNDWKELNELVPELAHSLTARPRGPLPYVEEFLYWSKESFGLKPVISVTDVFTYQLPGETWIASKQIYASHYFDASLAITLLADDPTDASGNRIYLAYVNRSRVDLLGGMFGGLKRSLAQGRLREAMRNTLETAVAKLASSNNCQSTF